MNVLVGFYTSETTGSFCVEVPLTGDGRFDNTALMVAVTERHPGVSGIVKTGTAIEQRDSSLSSVVFPHGSIIANLFSNPDESSITIGTVTFSQEPCNVILQFHREKNVASVSVRERRTSSGVRFGDAIKGQQLATELPRILKEVLGPSATDLKLTLKEVFPA